METTETVRPYHEKYLVFTEKASELAKHEKALKLLTESLDLLSDVLEPVGIDTLYIGKMEIEKRIFYLKRDEQRLYDELNAGNLRHVFYELMVELGKTREELSMAMMESVEEINDVLDKGRIDNILLQKLCSYFEIEVTYNLTHYQRVSGGRR